MGNMAIRHRCLSRWYANRNNAECFTGLIGLASSASVEVMTNDQRLKVISTVKQLLGLVGENAAPKTLVPIASAIIELGRVEDLLT